MRPEGCEESLSSVLQGMGSLHHQHLEALSDFTGGVGSVVRGAWTGLFLPCWELQCGLCTAQR